MFVGTRNGIIVVLNLPPDDGELPVWSKTRGFIIHGTGGVNGKGCGVGWDPVIP